MLILADKNGIVDMTPQAIHRRTNIPLEMILESLPKLEGPDKHSRTPDKDGRRIERLDTHREWGWRIINFEKYRESATVEMTRMCEKLRKQLYRSKFKKVSPHSPLPKTEEELEADAEAEQSMDKMGLSGTVRDKHRGLPKNEQQAGEWCEMDGVPKSFGIQIFCQLEGRSWVDGAGHPVNNFRRYTQHRWMQEQGRKEEAKVNHRERPLTPLDIRTIIGAKEQQAQELKFKHTEEDGPWGSKWKNEDKKKEFLTIKNEIKALNQKLSQMGNV
jgi:hypothetical protein